MKKTDKSKKMSKITTTITMKITTIMLTITTITFATMTITTMIGMKLISLMTTIRGTATLKTRTITIKKSMTTNTLMTAKPTKNQSKKMATK